MRPHYVSDYFPGHAVWLAAGRVLVGQRVGGRAGANASLFLLALYWMLRGWMPARWALFGVAAGGLRFAIGSYWINAYHGGFLPAIGGALVAGAFARLRKRAGISQGLVFGFGLAILASTRPVEGALYSIPFVAVLAWDFRRNALALIAAGCAGAALRGRARRLFLARHRQPVRHGLSDQPENLRMADDAGVHDAAEGGDITTSNSHVTTITSGASISESMDRSNFVQYLTFRIQEYWRFFLGPDADGSPDHARAGMAQAAECC